MKNVKGFVSAFVIVGLVAGCVFAEQAEKTEKTEKAEWQELFNGKDLTGWVQKGGEAKFFVEDGCIVGETVNDATRNSFLCTEKVFGDFVLECEFKVDAELNSGVQFRSETKQNKKDQEVVFGYQVEIDASEKPFEPKPESGRPANLDKDGNPVPDGLPRCWTGGIYDEGRRGWLCPLNKDPNARQAYKPNQWNTIKLEAVGESIKVWVNGIPTAQINDSQTPCGFIGFQVHRLKEPIAEPMHVRFRNIRIKDLSTG
jgi:ribosome-associated protein YbcJ (S4-like RNA binding protein)